MAVPIVGGLVVSALFKQLEHSVKSTINDAITNGEGAVLKGLIVAGQQLNLSIDHLKIAYKDCLDFTVDRVDQVFQDKLNQINTLIGQFAQRSLELIPQIMQQAQQIMNTIPFANTDVQLTSYSPRFIYPHNTKSFKITFNGNFIYIGEPGCIPRFLIDKQECPLKSSTTQELVFKIPYLYTRNDSTNLCSLLPGTLEIPDSAEGVMLPANIKTFKIGIGILPKSPGKIKVIFIPQNGDPTVDAEIVKVNLLWGNSCVVAPKPGKVFHKATFDAYDGSHHEFGGPDLTHPILKVAAEANGKWKLSAVVPAEDVIAEDNYEQVAAQAAARRQMEVALGQIAPARVLSFPLQGYPFVDIHGFLCPLATTRPFQMPLHPLVWLALDRGVGRIEFNGSQSRREVGPNEGLTNLGGWAFKVKFAEAHFHITCDYIFNNVRIPLAVADWVKHEQEHNFPGNNKPNDYPIWQANAHAHATSTLNAFFSSRFTSKDQIHFTGAFQLTPVHEEELQDALIQDFLQNG